jgi:hypothetical protein
MGVCRPVFDIITIGRRTAAMMDSQTLQSTPESGERAGYDGAKRRKDSKVRIRFLSSLQVHNRLDAFHYSGAPAIFQL